MLSRFVIAFLPRSKHLLISWLQSPPAVILEPKKIKSVTISIFSPFICHEVMGPDAMILDFLTLSFKPAFSLSFTFIKRLFSLSSLSAIQFSSVQSLSHVQLFVTPRIAARQASLSITSSRSLPKLMPIELVMPSSHLILCRPLLLLPPIPPSIRVFSNESTLRMRWPKYWSFSFSISPSNEHPGLISFRTDWLDLLAVQGTLKSLFCHQGYPSLKSVNELIYKRGYGKTKRSQLSWQLTCWLFSLMGNMALSAWRIWFMSSMLLGSSSKKQTASCGPLNCLLREVE